VPNSIGPPHHLHWYQLPPARPGSKRKAPDLHVRSQTALIPPQLKVPPYPVVSTKPPDALAGPLDTVPIHPAAQGMLDYEGELAVITGRDGKDVPESSALEYVLGYTTGNDVSARNFQRIGRAVLLREIV
jgi:2-keto-4-pentenoate hydratase/2-oxohepta-3-ene-1,7-dioic acid hydratase in catechol pathway